MNCNPWDPAKHGLSVFRGVLAWDVVINGDPQVIIDIPDHPHSYGDGPNTLYAAPRSTTTLKGNDVTSVADVVPWFRSDWHLWDVATFSSAHLKHKYGEHSWRVRRGARVLRNGVEFLSVYHRELGMAAACALAQIVKLEDHPLDLWSFEWDKKSIGREVLYNGQPARIQRFSPVDSERDHVFLVPDGIERFDPPPGWRVEDEQHAPCTPSSWYAEYAEGLYVPILSGEVQWWR